MKNTISIIAFVILCLGINIESFAQNIVPIDTVRKNIQAILDNATANYGMDGAALSLIFNDSMPTESFYSGLQSPGNAVDPNKAWHYAGATSGYTNYVILEMIEDGLLSLDDTIGMHMDATAMGLDASITIRQLIRHTSVLNEMWVTTSPFSACFQDIWFTNPSVLGSPADILGCKPADKTSPGAYDRNNMNLYVLEYLIDSITGNSYEVEFQNRIFNPFNMNGTYMSSSKTITIDSINGIYTTNSGYANNRSYVRYFSTSGANRGLISKPEDVVQFYRSLFQGNLLSASTMDSVRKEIPGSRQNIPVQALVPGACITDLSVYSGYNTDISEFINTAGDTSYIFGRAGFGMNGSISSHWPDKNWTFSFVQNDRSRDVDQLVFTIELLCYLENIDSIAYPQMPPAPQAAFTFTQSGRSVSFTDSSSNNPDTWSWDFGDGNTSTMQNPNHTYTTDGTYDVKLIASNSSGSDSITQQIIINTVAIESNLSHSSRIYPNPVRDKLIVDFDQKGNYEVSLFDVYGKILKTFKTAPNHYGEMEFTIPPNIENGTYLLRITSSSESRTSKVQIAR